MQALALPETDISGTSLFLNLRTMSGRAAGPSGGHENALAEVLSWKSSTKAFVVQWNETTTGQIGCGGERVNAPLTKTP
jgi:hypothetical protein